ncbi:MAG: hypothetical protein FWD29_09720, partial [Micrococcales bacterium]|nr:hypothetical protein [Micrococcales bacterium]
AGLVYFPGKVWLTHAEDDSGSVPLQAVVLESEPDPFDEPEPTTKPTLKPTIGTGSNTPGGDQPANPPGADAQAPPPQDLADGGGAGDEQPLGTTAANASDEVTADGIVYVGGLSARYRWSINPLGGSLALSVPIRNASPDPVSAVAEFSVKQIFGGQVGSKSVKLVLYLAPEESRIVTTSIHGMAQWTLVSSQVTVSRMGNHDAWGLGSVTRNSWTLFFPWFLVLMLAAGIVGAWWWRRRRKEALMRAKASGSGEKEEGIEDDDSVAAEAVLR